MSGNKHDSNSNKKKKQGKGSARPGESMFDVVDAAEVGFAVHSATGSGGFSFPEEAAPIAGAAAVFAVLGFAYICV